MIALQQSLFGDLAGVISRIRFRPRLCLYDQVRVGTRGKLCNPSSNGTQGRSTPILDSGQGLPYTRLCDETEQALSFSNSLLALCPCGRRQGNRRAVSPLSDPIQACGGRLLEKRAGPKRAGQRRRQNSPPTSTPAASQNPPVSPVLSTTIIELAFSACRRVAWIASANRGESQRDANRSQSRVSR